MLISEVFLQSFTFFFCNLYDRAMTWSEVALGWGVLYILEGG